MSVKFSVIMANYNKGKYIKTAIKSVKEQTFTNWELIIIDDKSSDDSVLLLKKYLNNHQIRLIKNKENKGKTEVLKRLIQESKGEIIAELDSDDFIAPNTLTEIVKLYNQNLEYGYVYTQCYYCDQNLAPRHLGFSAKIPEGKTNLHVNSVVAMRTFKKSDYLKTEGYDENILFAEDIDLILKMEEITKLHFIDKPLYYYRVLPKSQTHSFKNTRVNRSSTALAKLNAYQRRLNTAIPNLSHAEISAVLFFGIINALLARRFNLTLKFIKAIFKIQPLFFLNIKFYWQLFKKIKKIIILKKQKPLLRI